MKCEKCGNEIDENSKFCSNCGEPIKEEKEELIIEAEKIEPKKDTEEIKEEVKQEETKIEIIPAQETKEEKVKQVEFVNENEEKSGLSVASLILGIIAVLCVFEHGILNFVCGILAIIFGAIGRKKGAKGMGTTGMILGIASLALMVIVVIFLLIFASAFLYGIAAI